DGVQILSKALVELQELANAESGEQEGNRETCRIHSEEQHAARNRVAGSCKSKHGRENRADAGRPSERECKAEEKAAPDSGLFAATAQVDVAIEPARHRRAEESDDGEREEMNGAEAGEKRSTVDERNHAEKREDDAKNDSDADGQLDENA